MSSIAIFLSDYSLVGGVERVTSSLTTLFINNGLPIKKIISLYEVNKDHIWHYPKDVKLTVLCEKSIVKQAVAFSIIENYFLSENSITDLIIQVQDLVIAQFVLRICMRNGIRVYPVIHTSPNYYFKKYGSFSDKYLTIVGIGQTLKMQLYWKYKHRKIFKYLYDNSYQIICLSNNCVLEFKKNSRLQNHNKLIAIPNPLSFGKEDIPEEMYKENIIIFVGKLYYVKRPELLLQIWKKLSLIHPNWKLIICGSGPLKGKLDNDVRKYEILNIQFLDNVENMIPIYTKSKICISLSYFEGLSTALLEAASYKNALIGLKNDGGTTDIISNGVNGYYVDSKDQIIDKVSRLMMNPDLLKLIQENNLDELNKYSDKSIVEKWVKAIYNEHN